MTHVSCESLLHLVIRSSIHPCQGNWVAIGHTVVYYGQAANALRSGIKCRHCMLNDVSVSDLEDSFLNGNLCSSSQDYNCITVTSYFYFNLLSMLFSGMHNAL